MFFRIHWNVPRQQNSTLQQGYALQPTALIIPQGKSRTSTNGNVSAPILAVCRLKCSWPRYRTLNWSRWMWRTTCGSTYRSSVFWMSVCVCVCVWMGVCVWKVIVVHLHFLFRQKTQDAKINDVRPWTVFNKAWNKKTQVISGVLPGDRRVLWSYWALENEMNPVMWESHHMYWMCVCVCVISNTHTHTRVFIWTSRLVLN